MVQHTLQTPLSTNPHIYSTFTVNHWHFSDRLLHRWRASEDRVEGGKMETGPHICQRPWPTSALIQAMLPSAKQPKVDNYSSLHSPALCDTEQWLFLSSPRRSASPLNNNTRFTLANELLKGLFMNNRYESCTKEVFFFESSVELFSRHIYRRGVARLSQLAVKSWLHIGPVGIS